MFNINLKILYSDDRPNHPIKSLAKSLKFFPDYFWILNLSRSRSWGVQFGLCTWSEQPSIGLLISGFGISLLSELYKSTGQQEDEFVSSVVYPSSSRPPLSHELEPKLNYCWWWNSHKYAWEYADCRHCDLSIYTHFMDWRAIPYPGVTHVN